MFSEFFDSGAQSWHKIYSNVEFSDHRGCLLLLGVSKRLTLAAAFIFVLFKQSYDSFKGLF